MSQHSSKPTLNIYILAACLLSFLFGFFTGSFFSDNSGQQQNIYTNQQVGTPAQAFTSTTPTQARDPKLPLLEQETKKSPDSPGAWTNLAHAYYDSHMFKEAIAAYDKAIALNPNKEEHPDLLTDKGTMHRGLGQYDLALACYAQAITINPKHLNAHMNSGIVYFYDKEDSANALVFFQKVAAIQPNTVLPNQSSVKDMITHIKDH